MAEKTKHFRKAIDYAQYSVTLNHTMSNDFRRFSAGTRFVVMQAWQGKLRLALYAGAGDRGELKRVRPADVTLWRPNVGDRFGFLPEFGGVVTILELDTRGRGWHRVKFDDEPGDCEVHEQELGKTDD